jgi:hypothetical protein
MGRGIAQVVEHLPSSNPNTAKTTTTKRKNKTLKEPECV